MIRTSVTIDNTATPYLDKVLREMEQKQPVHQAMAEGATALVQRHFAGLGTSNRNRLGGRSGFWQRMLGGTKALATQSFGYVLMPRPVALRYFGGTVRPVNKKLLAIPARTEAYNRSPRDFVDLRFVKTKRGGMLVQKDQSEVGTKKETGGTVLYWLVKSVTVRGDTGVLPTMEALGQAAVTSGEDFIKRRLGLV